MENKFRGIVEASINQSGTSNAGKHFDKWLIVVSVTDYPNGHKIFDRISFTFLNTLVEPRCRAVGAEVEVIFTIEAKEYNGKWYNDVNGTEIKCIKEAADYKAAQDERIAEVMEKCQFPADRNEGENPNKEEAGDLPF